MEHNTKYWDDFKPSHHLLVNIWGRDGRFLMDVFDQALSRTDLVLVLLIVAIELYALEDAFDSLQVAVVGASAKT